MKILITGGGGLANFAGMSFASGGDTVNVKPALDTIATIKGAKFWKAGGDVVTGFKSGDIYAAVAHTGTREGRGAAQHTQRPPA